MKKVFNEGGTYLAQFALVIDVDCPKCGQPCKVRRGEENPPHPKFACGSCGYSTGEDRIWFKAWQAAYEIKCPECRGICRTELEEDGGSIPSSMMARCEDCGTQAEAPLRNWESEKGVHDPYFGMDLFFQMPVGKDILWAYNREHLKFLEDYVSAALREREPNMNASLVSRLPAWIKEAKNKGNVIKAIRELLELEEST